MEQEQQNVLMLYSSLGLYSQENTQKKKRERERTISNGNVPNSILIRTKIKLVLRDQPQGNRLSKFCIAITWDLTKLLRTVSDHVSRSMDRKVNMEQFKILKSARMLNERTPQTFQIIHRR